MTTLSIDKEQIAYDANTDTLYIHYGNYGDNLSEVVDITSNIAVMLGWPDGGFAGVEIYRFKQAFDSMPDTLELNVNEPITLVFPHIAITA